MYWALRTLLVTTSSSTTVKTKSRLTLALASCSLAFPNRLRPQPPPGGRCRQRGGTQQLERGRDRAGAVFGDLPGAVVDRALGEIAADHRLQLPGQGSHGFFLQSAAALRAEERGRVAEGERRDAEDEGEHGRRRGDGDEQAAPVPLAEQQDDRPDLDRRAEPGERAEPAGRRWMTSSAAIAIAVGTRSKRSSEKVPSSGIASSQTQTPR